jgi:hypothetical protein
MPTLNRKKIKKKLLDKRTDSIKTLTQNKSMLELMKLGITARQIKIRWFEKEFLSNSQKKGFSAKDLKVLGFKITDIQMARFSVKDLCEAGFTAKEMHNSLRPAELMLEAGYPRTEILKSGCFANELKEARFSAKEALSAGHDIKALIIGGYSIEEVLNALPKKFKTEQTKQILVKMQQRFNEDNIYSPGHFINPKKELGDKIKKKYLVRDLANAGLDFQTLLQFAYPLEKILDVFHKDTFYAQNVGIDFLLRGGCCSMEDIKNAYPRLSFRDLAIRTYGDFEFSRLGARFTSRGARDTKLFLKEPENKAKNVGKIFRKEKEQGYEPEYVP